MRSGSPTNQTLESPESLPSGRCFRTGKPTRKIPMKTLIIPFACCALMGLPLLLKADTTVTVDPTANWQGFMNVFELPANGGG